MPIRILIVAALVSLTASAATASQEVRVAVASNFIAPMRLIKKDFEASTSFKVSLSFASSGKLYAQIHNGAPYDLFLSADSTKPARLVKEGLAINSSLFTYALGTLVLWSSDENLLSGKHEALAQNTFNKLAIANPKLAPYGAAAMQVLQQLGLSEAVQHKIVKGENIAQAYQYVSSGNAQLGFVAYSQIKAAKDPNRGSIWIVPETLYNAIQQDAVLLTSGKNKPAAKKLLEYLQSTAARTLIKQSGYSVE
ncbi:molybdate transport system substrate-binding protein [Alteromonadaceae bacterium Bs31]|nr:molybdate transport system substrate-binding protein [Alteromonadaceae bacterium Bs31]